MSAPVTSRGPGWWAALAVGTATMAWGAWLFVEATAETGERSGFALWVLLSDVGVDWVVLPAVSGVGLALARWLPPAARPPVAVGLALSAVVVGLAWLPLTGSADPVGNPTIQPLDYGPLVLSTLGVIWLAMAAWWARRRWSHRG